MQLHPVNLAFQGAQKHLEEPFLNVFFIRSLPIFRFACIFVFLVYAAFGILDAYLLPEKKTLFWIIRYAIVCPVSFAIFLFSFLPIFKKLMQPVILLWGILAGAGIIAMILLAPPPVNFSYFAGLILVFMMTYSIVMFRFIWAITTSWSLIFLYNFLAIGFTDLPVQFLVNTNFFFVGANLIGMFSCYVIEYSARRDFFLKTLLKKEREKVQHSKDMLEQRVQERTSQLVKAEKARSEIQEKLTRHQKMESIGLMAGGVAHDLNNILSGIISYPELILMDLPADSKLRHPIEEIQDSGNRAAAVVADMLTVARGVACQKDIICINELVRNFLSSPEYKKLNSLYPNITLHTELKPELPMCKCSPVHIQKVIMNLILNAFEAVEYTGTITISTKNKHLNQKSAGTEMLQTGDYVLMSIADSGPGIPADSLQHIFEPFYTKKAMGRSGTGLGLAVVWNTIEDHGGTVYVESSSEGTLFTVYLPVTTEAQQLEQKCETDNLHGNETILIVDDEHQQRDISRMILTNLGYKVKTVDCGEKAVLYLQSHTVDLILLDMLMEPGMNGLQTYKEILKLYPKQKAIIASGFSENDLVKTTLELGAGKFIKKPYSMDLLGRAVKDEITRA